MHFKIMVLDCVCTLLVDAIKYRMGSKKVALSALYLPESHSDLLLYRQKVGSQNQSKDMADHLDL